MAQELILKTDKEPTFWNKAAAIGALGGLLIGRTVGKVAFSGGFLSTSVLVGGAIGALALGGIASALGKSAMKKEGESGKKIGTPSFWNRDTALGALIAIGANAIISTALAVTAVTLPAVVTIPLVIAQIAAPFVGAFIGGKAGEKRQLAEYEQANNQRVVQHISQTVSPEVGQAVEYAMANNKDWGKSILEEKLLNVGQEQGR